MPFCSFCGGEIPNNANFCGTCGRPRSQQFSAQAEHLGEAVRIEAADDLPPAPSTAPTLNKPTVGIVIAGILGVIDLWWALSSFTPGPLDLALFALVPALAPFTIVSASVNSLGNISLLAGIGLTILNHQNGPQVVRVTCGLMLVATVALGVGMFSAVSDSLGTMEPEFRAGFEGGMIGSVIGGLFAWSLIAILFKKSRSW